MKTFILTLLFAVTSSASARAATGIDGELVYRDNCSRCHTAIHAFSPRMMATVVRHMQIKAGLTSQERASVLQYLLQTVESRKAVSTRTKP